MPARLRWPCRTASYGWKSACAWRNCCQRICNLASGNSPAANWWLCALRVTRNFRHSREKSSPATFRRARPSSKWFRTGEPITCGHKPQASKDACHDAAFGADRGPVDDGCPCTGEESHDSPNFLGRFKTLQQRTGADIHEKLFLELRFGDALLPGKILDERADSLRSGRPNQDRVHSDARARNGLRNAPRDGNLRGFRHPVMNHFRGDLLRGFAGNKNDAAPVLAFH